MWVRAVFVWGVRPHIESAADASGHDPIGPDHQVAGGSPGFRPEVDDSRRLFPQTAQGIRRPMPESARDRSFELALSNHCEALHAIFRIGAGTSSLLCLS